MSIGTKGKKKEMENFAAKQREVAGRLDSGEVEMAEAQLQIEHYWAGALKRAVIDKVEEFFARNKTSHAQIRSVRVLTHIRYFSLIFI